MYSERLKYLINNFKNESPSRKAYIKRVINSLKVLSYIKPAKNSELINMIDEWSFVDSPDNIREVNYEKCQLCGQPENVYQFKITNRVTNNHIWTGSVCIENFSIPIYNKNGLTVINKDEIDSIFKTNIKDIKQQKRLELIKSLISDLNSKVGLNQVVHYNMSKSNLEEGIFTISQIKLISANYFRAYGTFMTEDYTSLFKVNMRLSKNKEQLRRFSPFNWSQLYPIFGKYIFKSENGFTDDIRNSSLQIISKYRPEYIETFKRKTDTKQSI